MVLVARPRRILDETNPQLEADVAGYDVKTFPAGNSRYSTIHTRGGLHKEIFLNFAKFGVKTEGNFPYLGVLRKTIFLFRMSAAAPRSVTPVAPDQCQNVGRRSFMFVSSVLAHGIIRNVRINRRSAVHSFILRIFEETKSKNVASRYLSVIKFKY